MNKNMLKKLVEPLMAGSAVLYLIALCIGITHGIIPYVLLLLVTCALTVVIIEAVVNKRSFVTMMYRLVAFFICWSGIFANQKEPVFEAICAMVAMTGCVILVGCFVYYMNTQNVRDADQRLNY